MTTYVRGGLAVMCLGGVALGLAQTPREPEPEMGHAVYVGDTILRPYDPTPALVTKETRLDHPKYPATDIHAHWPADLEPASLLAAMKDLGVDRAVNLSGGYGEHPSARVRFADGGTRTFTRAFVERAGPPAARATVRPS